MFNKLRLKLALTNAAVAAVILLAISAAFYAFVWQIVTRQSIQNLNTIANDLLSSDFYGGFSPAKTIRIIGGSNRFFSIKFDNDSSAVTNVIDIGTGLSEEQMVELVNKALAIENGQGDRLAITGDRHAGVAIFTERRSEVVRLADGRAFRYRLMNMRFGSSSSYMIFMDMQQEEAQLGNVRLALLGCVLGGLLLTLLGGLFLAGRALRPIRAAWQKQRDFVADASHELRSPLAAIRCNLDVVLDEPGVPVGEKQEYWQGIVEETGRMTLLVDDLLLLARADSGAITLQTETVDLAAVAEGALGVIKPLAAKKGVGLSVEIKESAHVTGDPARLKQVIIILLDNAVKYTPEGGNLKVTVRRAKDRAAVDVTDTGIGIAREHHAKIFDRFYRVDAARNHEGGHGLGLSIAKFIMERHGGGISVASEPDKGSTFTVTMPVAKE